MVRPRRPNAHALRTPCPPSHVFARAAWNECDASPSEPPPRMEARNCNAAPQQGSTTSSMAFARSASTAPYHPQDLSMQQRGNDANVASTQPCRNTNRQHANAWQRRRYRCGRASKDIWRKGNVGPGVGGVVCLVAAPGWGESRNEHLQSTVHPSAETWLEETPSASLQTSTILMSSAT